MKWMSLKIEIPHENKFELETKFSNDQLNIPSCMLEREEVASKLGLLGPISLTEVYKQFFNIKIYYIIASRIEDSSENNFKTSIHFSERQKFGKVSIMAWLRIRSCSGTKLGWWKGGNYFKNGGSPELGWLGISGELIMWASIGTKYRIEPIIY